MLGARIGEVRGRSMTYRFGGESRATVGQLKLLGQWVSMC
jgi:hypothetical protein